MATIDDVYNILLRSGNMVNTTFSPHLVMLQNFIQQYGPNGLRDIGDAMFDVQGKVIANNTADAAKFAALDAHIQVLQDKLDTLLNTLNGGHIDTNLDLVITKVSAIEDTVGLIGESTDDWNDGQHTILGSLNAGFGGEEV